MNAAKCAANNLLYSLLTQRGFIFKGGINRYWMYKNVQILYVFVVLALWCVSGELDEGCFLETHEAK